MLPILKMKLSLRFVIVISAMLTPLAASAQYTAADCTVAPTVASDSRTNCATGVLFNASPLPTGSFHTLLLTSRASVHPNDPTFHFTAPSLGYAGMLDATDELDVFNPGSGAQVYMVATRGFPGTLADTCQKSNGGFPMRSCPTSYGRFFEVDGDMDGQFDDMTAVFIDGSLQPLNFRVLFVPANWTGTQAAFQAAAQAQINLFANSTTLGGCINTIEPAYLDVATQNMTFTCTANSCNVGSVAQYVRSLGLGTSSYDLLVALLPAGASPCAPTAGCSNGFDSVWLTTTVNPVLAHEIGHIYGLDDEYCSEQAGGDFRCAGPGNINFLGVDLGCNPAANQGCCGDCSAAGNPAGAAAGNYFACCQGNLGTLGGGSRCTMSSSGAGAGAQNWCQRCRNLLNGRTEFKCDPIASIPFRNVVTVDLTVDNKGSVIFNASELGKGRPSRTEPIGNRFRVRLDGPAGNLLDKRFDIIQYDIATPQTQANFRYRAPVDFPLAKPPPLALSVTDGGKKIFRGTLFGTAPVAKTGPNVQQQCSSPAGKKVSLDAGASFDTDGDLLAYLWSGAGVSFDDPTSKSPTGDFPIGTSNVKVTVSDGVSSSTAGTTVTILDTAKIAADAYDATSPRNDSWKNPAVIPGQVAASPLVMKGKIDNLTHDTSKDIDFFTVQLPPAQSECCPSPLSADTIQGQFKISVEPTADRPFEIVVYDAKGKVFNSSYSLDYVLECPHKHFPDGKITFSVRDTACRNSYEIFLGYNRCNTRFYPRWILEYDPPLFRRPLPPMPDDLRLIFPGDPELQEKIYRGEVLERIPAEHYFFEWPEAGDYGLDIAVEGDAELEFTLLDPEGQVVTRAMACDGELRGQSQTIQVADLPAGTYALRVEGAAFGTRYVLDAWSTSEDSAR